MRPDTRHETNDDDTVENMYDGMSEKGAFRVRVLCLGGISLSSGSQLFVFYTSAFLTFWERMGKRRSSELLFLPQILSGRGGEDSSAYDFGGMGFVMTNFDL